MPTISAHVPVPVAPVAGAGTRRAAVPAVLAAPAATPADDPVATAGSAAATAVGCGRRGRTSPSNPALPTTGARPDTTATADVRAKVGAGSDAPNATATRAA